MSARWMPGRTVLRRTRVEHGVTSAQKRPGCGQVAMIYSESLPSSGLNLKKKKKKFEEKERDFVGKTTPKHPSTNQRFFFRLLFLLGRPKLLNGQPSAARRLGRNAAMRVREWRGQRIRRAGEYFFAIRCDSSDAKGGRKYFGRPPILCLLSIIKLKATKKGQKKTNRSASSNLIETQISTPQKVGFE